jgi:hypothetical protein
MASRRRFRCSRAKLIISGCVRPMPPAAPLGRFHNL